MYKHRSSINWMHIFLMNICLVVAGFNGYALAADGTISGHVYEAGGTTAIGNLHIYATDSTTDDWVNGVNTEADGSYSLMLPAGSYRITTCSDCTGLPFFDEYFDGVYNDDSATVVSVTAGQETQNINFSLGQGGYISGTITTVPAVANLDNIQVIVWDQGEQITSVPVNSDGSYMTDALREGTYEIKFTDSGGQFQEEFYDQVPPWDPWASQSISVLEGITTPNINVTLKQITDDRYHPGWPFVSTYHTYNNSDMSFTTKSVAETGVVHFSDNGRIDRRQTIESALSVVTPSGTCTDDYHYVDAYWRLRENDDNSNGIIDDSEDRDPAASTDAGIGCNLGAAHHAGGNYT